MTYLEYVERKTAIHGLHPLTKLAFLTAIFIITTLSFNPLILALLLGFVLAIWLTSKVPLRPLRQLLLMALGTCVFFTVVQGFLYYRGKTPIFRLGNWGAPSWLAPGHPGLGTFTLEGFLMGLAIGLKIFTIIYSVAIFVMTTPMTDLVASLSKLRVPYKATFLFTTALRFTPYVYRAYDIIQEAQKLRAFDRKRLGPIERFRTGFIPLVTPLILSLYRQSKMLEMAMMARAFGASEKRTHLIEPRFGAGDLAFLAVCTAFFALVVYLHTVLPSVLLRWGLWY